ncbi:uncharacterized protein LOC121265792 [Juglans microcarpa x Juglans regia]|uniref:uncharacterized protein LOC121265792 n=1 Tax=Juglans microcarpa x Juglans regia TaxID=2249226 RepID=UPI001B7DD891|nr:uncharacterized protein LOC121265792 [Juglans microcarpa x Juglans regia]
MTTLVANFTTQRILIDNGCFVDILFWDVFSKMDINPNCLRPTPMRLKGFTGDFIQPLGAITLPLLVGKASRSVVVMTDFLVVKVLSSYNEILGWPTLNNLRAVKSMYHLKMKFLTRVGVGKIKGEQVLAQECYVQKLKAEGSDVRDLNGSTHGERPPPPPKLASRDKEFRDEQALK